MPSRRRIIVVIVVVVKARVRERERRGPSRDDYYYSGRAVPGVRGGKKSEIRL